MPSAPVNAQRKPVARLPFGGSLVARGLTNRQIAAQLHISVRTVEVVDHILTVGFKTRTQLAS